MRSLLLALILSLPFSLAQAGEWGAIRRNNDGVKKFESGRPVEAYDRFTSALGDLPFSGAIHYNLGTSFLQTKEFEKALSEYHEAIRLSKGDSRLENETRFRALFNSAVALTELKKNEEALELYQQALDIKPDSLETKTNIELLSPSGKDGSGGDNKKKDDKGDKKKDDGKPDQKPDPNKPSDGPPDPKRPPQPKPFDSRDLSQQDVNRILEELKRQEEQVRAKMNHQGGKDVPPDKDW